MKQDTVIIYRSRMEQQADEFWAKHPEYQLMFVGLVAILAVVAWIYNRRR